MCNEKIDKYLEDLERKSLITKIDQLYKMCKPSGKHSFIRNYKFDQAKIKEIDTLRHEIIHGKGLSAPLPDCTQKIKYLLDTTNNLMGLVNDKYNVRMNPTAWKESLKDSSKNV